MVDIVFAGDGPQCSDAEAEKDFKRFTRLRLELKRQSDRGAAILGAPYVELALERAVKTRVADAKVRRDKTLFDRLFKDRNAPLGTFSAKIDLAFGLLLIGKHTYHDLGIIRGVRNDFAHELDTGDATKGLTFDSQSIRDRCNNLWVPKNDSWALQLIKSQDKRGLDTPRGKYEFSIFSISHLVTVVSKFPVGMENAHLWLK